MTSAVECCDCCLTIDINWRGFCLAGSNSDLYVWALCVVRLSRLVVDLRDRTQICVYGRRRHPGA
jgi:hypothetical protein